MQLVSVAENLRRLREAKGWSKLELARRLGGKNSRTEVYLWESGRRVPTGPTLEKLAGILETDLATIDPEDERSKGRGRKRLIRIQKSHTTADSPSITRAEEVGELMAGPLPPLPDIDLFVQVLSVWRLLDSTEKRRDFVTHARAFLGIPPEQAAARKKDRR